MADLKEYHLDEEGFLEKPETWDPGFSEWLAASEGVELTEAHRELILATREFYDLYHFSPSMRPLIKFLAQTLGDDKGRSIYLMKLFPGSPARELSRYAGLHKPKNCL